MLHVAYTRKKKKLFKKRSTYMKVSERIGTDTCPAGSIAFTTILYSSPGVSESPFTDPPVSPPKLTAPRTSVPLVFAMPTTYCSWLDSASTPSQRPLTSVASATVANWSPPSAYVLGMTVTYCMVGVVRSTRTPSVLYSALRPAPFVKMTVVTYLAPDTSRSPCAVHWTEPEESRKVWLALTSSGLGRTRVLSPPWSWYTAVSTRRMPDWGSDAPHEEVRLSVRLK